MRPDALAWTIIGLLLCCAAAFVLVPWLPP